MKRNKKKLFVIIIVILIMSITCNVYASKTEKDTQPKTLKLNPNFIFDKESIKNWVEDHSWEEANSIAWNNHSQGIEEGMKKISGVIYTPVVQWTREHYKGVQQFYDQEIIKKNYYNNFGPLESRTGFRIKIISPNKKNTKKENLRFILEDRKKHWETKSENIYLADKQEKSILGTDFYINILDIYFTFYEKEDYPDFNGDIKLHILYKSSINRDTLTWNFSNVNIEEYKRKTLIDNFINKFYEVEKEVKIKILKIYHSNLNPKILSVQKTPKEFSKDFFKYKRHHQKTLLKLGLDTLSIEKINELKKELN